MNGHHGLVLRDRSNGFRRLVHIIAVALVAAACTTGGDATSPMGASGSGSASGGATGMLDYDRDRIRDVVDARDLVRINTEIGMIQVAVVDDELAAAAAAAERLRVTLADLRPLR
jgi:hypothetical protein